MRLGEKLIREGKIEENDIFFMPEQIVKFVRAKYLDGVEAGYEAGYKDGEIAGLESKAEELKEDDEIRVGDEVEDDRGATFIMTHSEPKSRWFCLLGKDGHTTTIAKNLVKKTGRHFNQIEELLKEIKNEKA